jgi:hypothetical protein
MSTSKPSNSWIDQLPPDTKQLVYTKIGEISSKQLDFLTRGRMTFEEAERWGTIQTNLLRVRYLRENPCS